MKKKDFKRTLLARYKKLSPLIQKHNYFSLLDFKTEQFLPTLIAAFVKCYEFNLDINKAGSKSNAFYNTSFLRGICEDLIALKFIVDFEPAQRNELIITYNQYLLLSSVKSQSDFFSRLKPFQPIVSNSNVVNQLKEVEKALHKFWEKKGHRKDKVFPGVEHMAIDSKLKSLYDYLYHATSKTVHFSPNILLRTGWYKSKDDPIVFSVKNFSQYYDLFNAYYASYLFLEFCKSFMKVLKLDKTFLDIVKSVEGALNDLDYLPELVTFEELNLKRPNYLPYKVLEMASKMEAEEKKAFFDQLPEILKEVKKRVQSPSKGKKTKR